MSHAGNILGLPELEVERVDRNDSIEVYARPKRRPSCIHCQHPKVRIKATHERTLKHTRQGNQVMTLHLKTPKYHCLQCGRYFRHRFQGVRPRYRSSDAFRLEVFEAHDGGVTQRKLARTHDMSPATVERWYQGQCRLRLSEMSNRPCPRVLGIDEHFFSRKRGYATTMVDLKNHKVFDVVLGRSELSLRRYLKALPGKENVQVVVMDLSETYRSIVRRYFPNATIVADRFHVIRLVNQHLLKAWQNYDPEGRKHRGLISLMRRHEWRLADEQKENLARYLDDYPVLKALYRAKQQLNRLLLLKSLNRKKAKQLLPQLLSLIEDLAASPLHRLARTLKSWLEPIVGMWRFTKTNGITEGFHNKMEMMSRRAYGFRNFENYRLRVLTHCGWDGIINRV
ncbi:ISL3 family transposase [Congregibacter brevis]|uniref:ISL3 family transposase n=1 Tax=Congregibacter brevis TaxID=3081201 RepID=A0ABZ0IA41_9GAMM|nr:ISL3 family transposase [Congregibacter sp. IMCC45268]WOJ97646.1 ISL3 family transposase [Congregibacter sp. IMCC45268]WOJ98132.1 ISL3 family transposase [Congregibacter sp. IMCC45268]